MRGAGAGGFLLLLVGALGLIGFLTGNLDRWLGYLFSPGTPVSTGGAPAAATALPSSANNRGSVA